ncbi:TPA: hypothetical protein ACG5TP_001976 [Streptococcus agalactiae]|uniref:DUF2758 domain-containing protein n=1 Tax=Streptococcus agalactiae TaxID=1311 RepID=A0A853P407_STRAG|nr:hypothetical protein [Streptococcus agalactiae]QBX10891.1 hypothetical protein JavanS50_0017 [Streptococcus satellite phage Javan50]AIF87630.1 hypothetical protein EN72_11200 [Streptococcus agalactiae]EJS82813.1 hypothetical protein GB112_01349 [Streptococcus agalactiae GB00112]EMA8746673.1 hypothetical protein [Streptococcus agalactiae]EMC0662378.1 hypothetical protein [Streptococcus agalactiae]
MKIKLFNRKRIETGFNEYMDLPKFRNETNEEFENRVNSFIADKKVIDIKYQEATYGNYEDMSTTTSLLVLYR